MLTALVGPREAVAMQGLFVPSKAVAGARAPFGRSGRVVVARAGKTTTLTIASTYRGEPGAFAWVVPVPATLSRERVRLADRRLLDRLARITAPRTEQVESYMELEGVGGYPVMKVRAVEVEARPAAGEYDISILDARQSSDIEEWLEKNGYTVSPGAAVALQSCIRRGMRFLVAKVTLKELPKTGFADLPPLQFSYEDQDFTLPVRLGMADAEGPQDLTIFFLTRGGRVEANAYRTMKVPDSQLRNRGEATPGYNLPLIQFPMRVTEGFAAFYEALIATALGREGGRAVFTEYSAAANLPGIGEAPLTAAELYEAGVSWEPFALPEAALAAARFKNREPELIPGWLTRLRLRSGTEHFLEELAFQETADHSPFVPVFNVAVTVGDLSAAKRVADLTGWDLESIPYSKPPPSYPQRWAAYWGDRLREMVQYWAGKLGGSR